MPQIQPFSLWTDKGTKTAEFLEVRGAGDDYETTASNYYALCTLVIGEEGETLPGEIVASGNVPISAEDYALWDGSNEWIIQWVASKLGVVLL